MAATAAAAALAIFGRAPTAMLIAVVAALAAGAALWRQVTEGNRAVARFVTALDHTDLAQSFRHVGRGAGFDVLGAAFEGAVARLRAERATGADAARFADALIDAVPTSLLVVSDAGVRPANGAARRLLGREGPCAWDALAPLGEPFVTALRAAEPGGSRLSVLPLGGLPQRVALDVTRLEGIGPPRRIVVVHVIQGALDSAELAAQTDLVRVLTHEVMNSLTPVISLAATAQRLVEGLDADAPDVADAQLALRALARRATELERFVASYKGFSDPPPLHPEAIATAPWIAEMASLFAASPGGTGVVVRAWAAPGTPAIAGDRALLGQVLLNLLKNAGEAAADRSPPTVELSASPAEDGRVRLIVADNGPGIPAELAHDVFLPFFTTKPGGTGIGLCLSRQIVLLHGGQIGIAHDHRGIEMLLPGRGRGDGDHAASVPTTES